MLITSPLFKYLFAIYISTNQRPLCPLLSLSTARILHPINGGPVHHQRRPVHAWGDRGRAGRLENIRMWFECQTPRDDFPHGQARAFTTAASYLALHIPVQRAQLSVWSPPHSVKPRHRASWLYVIIFLEEKKLIASGWKDFIVATGKRQSWWGVIKDWIRQSGAPVYPNRTPAI